MLSSEGDNQNEASNKEVSPCIVLYSDRLHKLWFIVDRKLRSSPAMPRKGWSGPLCLCQLVTAPFPPYQSHAYVPVVEAGTFPFYRTEDTEEERFAFFFSPLQLRLICHFRRLLYVACTRAQCLLYLSHVEKRKVAGETKNKLLSPFLATIKQENQVRVFIST
jgi:hypothetical protein